MMSCKWRHKLWSNMRYYVKIFLDKITGNLVQDTNMAFLGASQSLSTWENLLVQNLLHCCSRSESRDRNKHWQ